MRWASACVDACGKVIRGLGGAGTSKRVNAVGDATTTPPHKVITLLAHAFLFSPWRMLLSDKAHESHVMSYGYTDVRRCFDGHKAQSCSNCKSYKGVFGE